MRRIRVYADTSVFGGTEDEEFAEASKRFFDLVNAGKYCVLVSQVTLDELDGAPDRVRAVMAALPEGSAEEAPVGVEVSKLAQAYIDAGVLSDSSRSDAVHVAAATVARADVILSWNFKHIVNYDRIRKFNGVNALNGYPQIEIHSPLEMDDGN